MIRNQRPISWALFEILKKTRLVQSITIFRSTGVVYLNLTFDDLSDTPKSNSYAAFQTDTLVSDRLLDVAAKELLFAIFTFINCIP